MSSLNGSDLIVDEDQLVAFLADGSKPRSEWRIGTEHEKFAFDPETLKPWAMRVPRGSHFWKTWSAMVGCQCWRMGTP